MVLLEQPSPSKDHKPLLACMERGPGPAKYNLPGTCGYKSHNPSRHTQPAYSFGVRYKQFSSMGYSPHSPGPTHFVAPQVTRRGKDGTPAYTIYGRLRSLTTPPTPGPAAYDVRKVPRMKERRPPAYSFGLKTNITSKKVCPPPNAYSLPVMTGSQTVGRTSSAAYSLTGRSKIGSFHEDRKKTPGPGTYSVIATSVTRIKSPSYSLKARVYPPEHWKGSPGPAAYNPQPVNTASSYTFGVKHSEFVAPIVEQHAN